MPTIVELPDKTELEFPDGMDQMAMREEIAKAFPQFVTPTPSESPAIPAPGQTAASKEPIIPYAPGQVFPAREQQFAEGRAYDPSMSAEEAEALLMTPGIQIPNVVPKSWPITRGVFQTAKSIPEFVTAPGAPYLMAAQLIPGVRETVDALMGAGMVKSAAQLAGEASATGNREQMAEAVTSGLLGAGMVAGPHVSPILADEIAARRVGSPDVALADMAARQALSIRDLPLEIQQSLVAQAPATPPTGGLFNQRALENANVALASRPKGARPVIPETPPEPERGLTVIQEIRARGADTKEKIRALFPQLSRETAAKLRDQAFPREKIPDNLSQNDVDRLFLDRLNEESNREIEQAERIANASRQQEAATVYGNLRPPAVEGAREVPAQESGQGVQPQTTGGIPQKAKAEPAKEGVESPANVVRDLALKAQREAGWNPKWPFVPADLLNADFRDLIRNDPGLSTAEKDQIFTAGEKLGVVSKGEPRTAEPAAQPLTPSEQADVRAELAKATGEETPEPAAPPAKVEAESAEAPPKIVAVASRLGEQIETGRIHLEAEQKLRRKLGISTEDPRAEDIEHGFLDDKGNFLGREEAWEVARKANQLKTTKTEDPGFLGKEDLKKGAIEPTAETPKPAEPAKGEPATVDPHTMSDVQIQDELNAIKAKTDPLYSQLEAMPEGGYTGPQYKATPEAQAVLDQLKPWQQRKEFLDIEVRDRETKARNEKMFAERDKRVAAAPVKERRNGWEIVKEGADYVLRHPETKEDIYRGKLTRVRQVADESKPEAAAPKPEASTQAAAKVEQEVQNVAKTEGQRPAKEVKSELVQRIESELAKVPKYTREVTFSEPATYSGQKKIRVRPSEPPWNNELTIEQDRQHSDMWHLVVSDYVASAKNPRELRQVIGSNLSLREAKEQAIEQINAGNPWHLDKEIFDQGKSFTPDVDKMQAQGHAFRAKPETVTIEIPGDGIFTIPRTRYALERLLARAKAIETSPVAGKGYSESKPTKAEGQQWLKEAQTEPPKPRESAPPTTSSISPGPGAAAAGEPGTYSAISQLSDKLKTTPAATPSDGLKAREKLADAWAEGKGLMQRVFARLRTIPETLKAQYQHIRSLDDVTRRIAEFDAVVQQSVVRSKQAGKAFKAAIRNTDMRNGMAFIMEGATDAQIRTALDSLPEGTKPYVRRALESALKLPQDVRDHASNLRDFYEQRGHEAIDEGIMEKLLEDYYTHVWKDSRNMPSKLANALNRGRVNEYFQYAMRRRIPTLLEGIAEGKEPVLDPASVIPRYNYLLDRAIASRHLMKALEDVMIKEVDPATGETSERPLLAPTGTRTTIYDQNQVPQARLIKIHISGEKASDYRAIDHPSLRKWIWAATDEQGVPVFYEGDLRVHPDHYERLARMMDRSRLTAGPMQRKLLAVSTEVKGFKLGVASFFHPVQVGTHALFHLVSPLVKGEIDADSPMFRFAVEKGGVNLAPDQAAITNFAEGILTRGLVNKIPIIGPWSHALAEWTFGEYIPRLKLATFEAFYERNLKRYPELTDEQNAARAGDAVNNAYGELNHLWLGKEGRDPATQRLLRLGFLAPDFGEARLRFVSKAFTRYGGEERLGLIVAGTSLFLLSRALNIMTHGDPELADFKHMFDVKIGDRWIGLRSIVGDISHLLLKPRQFWEVRLNPLYSRSLLALLSGRDVAGHRLTPGTFAKDVAKQVVPIHLSGLTRDDRQVWESFLAAMGLQTWRAGATSEIHRLAQDWRDQRGIKDETEVLPAVDSPYRKARLALEFQDRVKFRQAITELYNERRKLGDPTPRQTIQRNFNRYYHQPFAGNQRLELLFKRSLTSQQQSVYRDAQGERNKLWRQFETWF